MKMIAYEEMTEEQKRAYDFAKESCKLGNCTLVEAVEFLKKMKITIEE